MEGLDAVQLARDNDHQDNILQYLQTISYLLSVYLQTISDLDIVYLQLGYSISSHYILLGYTISYSKAENCYILG